jgi:hypothetical protein
MYGEYAGIHYDDEDNEEEFKWESGENEDSGDRDN